MAKRRIIGVDPGTIVTGWGVIDHEGSKFSLVDYGVIKPKSKELSERYYTIYQELTEILKTFSPLALSVETQFVQKNIQSALKLGMARGVIIVAALNLDIPIFEYAPTRAKQAVTGKGNASKDYVQKMVKLLLGLSHIPESEDAADALALAITHANTKILSEKLCTHTSKAR